VAAGLLAAVPVKVNEAAEQTGFRDANYSNINTMNTEKVTMRCSTPLNNIEKNSSESILHCGINAAPCAKRCQACFQNELMADKLNYEADGSQ